MGEPVPEKIKRSVHAAESLYHRLILLVGAAGTGKTGVLLDVATEIGVPVVNVNLALSSELLELTAKQRSLQLPRLFRSIVEESHGLVMLDNLEILFDKDLMQDPLRLLQGVARNRVVVASWNGSATENKLLYAEMSNPEYRSYDAADLLIVNMRTSEGGTGKNIREVGQV